MLGMWELKKQLSSVWSEAKSKKKKECLVLCVYLCMRKKQLESKEQAAETSSHGLTRVSDRSLTTPNYPLTPCFKCWYAPCSPMANGKGMVWWADDGNRQRSKDWWVVKLGKIHLGLKKIGIFHDFINIIICNEALL